MTNSQEDGSLNDGMVASRRSELAFVLLVGVGVPLVYSLVLATQARTGPSGTGAAVLRNTVPAALLGVAAWYAARRIARLRASPMMIAHGAAAGAYGIIWAFATFSGFGFFPDPRGWADFARYSLSWFVLFGALLYGIIAGAAHVSVGKEALRAQHEAALKAQSAAARAQLEALRARLDPHFLFNALHSLAILAHDDPPTASRGLTALAQLLRYVLDAGRENGRDVALDDEVAFIVDYLALERLRLGERLAVTIDVEDEARECGVPAFVLQPLVENAIRHAIAPRPEGGTVAISAFVKDERLILEVADDGRGPSKTDHGTAAMPPLEAVDAPRSGIGLRTVRELLRVRFGENASCEITRNKPHGVVARIEIPAASQRRA